MNTIENLCAVLSERRKNLEEHANKETRTLNYNLIWTEIETLDAVLRIAGDSRKLEYQLEGNFARAL